ncbi:unnamed protein product [Adineta ricciae]|uniref:VWFA domain-containing protein n=1 Tax=Adineta ricciae TaxID=249248 RepID=A0A814QQJ0_ADIRI|nr:unnamed protein product [Adineta ricciae]CAF1336300.1 unnamed protein product [Adineta ricciae]
MIDSLDIAFLLADKSTTNLFPSVVTHLISSIISPLIENDYDIRLALNTYKSTENSSIAITHPFTKSIHLFKDYLSMDKINARQENIQLKKMSICKTLMFFRMKILSINILGDILRSAFRFEWRPTSSDCFHENVVFLITDDVPCREFLNPSKAHDPDAPCACDQLEKISNDFLDGNFTLIVIGVGELVSICDSLYADTARNTGGEYIPLTNAARVLHTVVESVISQGYTVSQSLRHIKEEEYEKNSSFCCSRLSKRNQCEMKHCQVMAHKGVWLLNRCRQPSY